ncbi:MAG TPA: crosslink repair DNA glycosylase YcaQ family protein [Candidatus Binataceae bacterium]
MDRPDPPVLAAYGPATRVDYSRWSGAPLAHADAMLRSLGPDVSEISLAGAQAWVLSEDVKELVAAERSQSVRLLPAFDQYVIAASPHVQNLLSAGHREDIFRPQGWISPVLLVDGRIDGVWSYQRNGPRLVVRIGPFVRLTRRVQSAVEVEAERLAKFFDAELELKQD